MRANEITGLLSVGLLGGLLCVLTSCAAPEEAIGPTTIPCLRVLVIDSQTGTPVAAATVTATGEGANEVLAPSTGQWGRDLAYADSMYQGVYQAGTYQVSVVAAGYEPAVLDAVQIPQGRYFNQDVVPVDLLVELTPTPVWTSQTD